MLNKMSDRLVRFSAFVRFLIGIRNRRSKLDFLSPTDRGRSTKFDNVVRSILYYAESLMFNISVRFLSRNKSPEIVQRCAAYCGLKTMKNGKWFITTSH